MTAGKDRHQFQIHHRPRGTLPRKPASSSFVERLTARTQRVIREQDGGRVVVMRVANPAGGSSQIKGYVKTFAIDFETFYDKDFDIKKQGSAGYVEDPRFDAYLLSVACDDGYTFVGDPKAFDWTMLAGHIVVAHNASFDEHIFLRYFCDGDPAEFHCTADLAAFCGYPRSLEGVMKQAFGKARDKTVRDRMKGMDRKQAAALPENRAYALEDAVDCLRVWQTFSAQWPEVERRLSRMTREIGWRGMNIDIPYAKQCLADLHQYAADARQRIPWVADAAALSDKELTRWLTARGIPVPKSKAKNDEDFAAWLKEYAEGDKPAAFVKDICALRSMSRTLSTFQTLIDRVRPDGSFPYSKLYCGAHTRRWSGAGGYNMENQNRDDKFGTNQRRCFIPRAGYRYVIVDYSQIEPRVCAWRTGEDELLDMCRTMSPYDAWGILNNRFPASELDAFKKARKVPGSEADMLYKCLKEESLSLIYGVGWEKHGSTLARFGLKLTEAEVRARVDGFRAARPKLIDTWKRHEQAFRARLGGLVYAPEQPSGRRLHYFNPRQHQIIHKGKLKIELLAEVVAGGRRAKPNDAVKRIYGAYLHQNDIQSLSRDAFAERTLAVCDGLPDTFLCLTAHDEDVFEVPAHLAQERAGNIREILIQPPEWMKGVPLDVSVEIADHYKK
jgi:DNA polymerase